MEILPYLSIPLTDQLMLGFLQGKRGKPGKQGLSGLKGYEVSWLFCSELFCSLNRPEVSGVETLHLYARPLSIFIWR